MAYLKFEFIHNANGDKHQFWMESSYTNIWQAAYNGGTLCTGYFIGTGYKGEVVTATNEQPDEPLSTAEEIETYLRELNTM